MTSESGNIAAVFKVYPQIDGMMIGGVPTLIPNIGYFADREFDELASRLRFGVVQE